MIAKSGIPFLLVLLFLEAHLKGQIPADSLFSSRAPLDISLKISINSIKDSKKDSVYLTHMLSFRQAPGPYDSIKVDLKGRGNFRMRECYFPPLWIKIKSADAKGTVFEGNKKLKLVLPCYKQEIGNILSDLRNSFATSYLKKSRPILFKQDSSISNYRKNEGKKAIHTI